MAAPYIMPDGRSLKEYLRAEREKEERRKLKQSRNEARAKDESYEMLLKAKAAAQGEHELKELKAMEAAGARRRRRYINDRVLRDMAGPLNASDMEAQFKPAPFGYTKPSIFSQVTSGESAPVWDNFRNIDPEKEKKVLEKWAEHQREMAASGGFAARARPYAAASEALQRWSRVSRVARTALKQANATSVLALELQILSFVERAQPHEHLVMQIPDSFGRLLVHGLAEYYGLLSTSKTMAGTAPAPAAAVGASSGAAPAADGGADASQQQQHCVVVYFRRARAPARPGDAAVVASPTHPQPSSSSSSSLSSLASLFPASSRFLPTSSRPAPPPQTPPPQPQLSSPAPAAQVGGVGSGMGRTSSSGGTGSQPAPSPSQSPSHQRPTSHSSSRSHSVTPGVGQAALGQASGSTSVERSRSAHQQRERDRDRDRGLSGTSEGRAGLAQLATRPGAGAGARPALEIACTDVLLAMAEVGQLGLSPAQLQRYVETHIHGGVYTPTAGQAARMVEGDWLMV